MGSLYLVSVHKNGGPAIFYYEVRALSKWHAKHRLFKDVDHRYRSSTYQIVVKKLTEE